jgi:HTH-type transcriptional regulator/antitoxin HigA
MTAKKLDDRQYGDLLASVRPHRIRTDAENDQALETILGLMGKGDERSLEEDELHDLLGTLVERYESDRSPIPDAAPQEVLAFMLEQRDLRPVDLVPIFGSRGYVSDILADRRNITAEKARALGEFFNLSPGLFV